MGINTTKALRWGLIVLQKRSICMFENVGTETIFLNYP